MKTVIGYVLNFIVSLASGAASPIGLAWTAMTLAIGFFKFSNDIWGLVVLKIAALAPPTPLVGSALSGLEFIDYVFPVHEAFTFCVSYSALVLACAVVRIVKSFVPTISG